MCAHLLPEPFRYFFTGAPAVVAFFVISGFCIHHPYRDASPDVMSFWTARAIRILPPAMIAMVWAQLEGIRAFNPIDGFILWSIVCELVYYIFYPLTRKLATMLGWETLILVAIVWSYFVIFTQGTDEFGNIHIYGPGLNWLVLYPAWLIGAYVAELKGLKVLNVWVCRFGIGGIALGLQWFTLHTVVGYYLTLIPFSFLVAIWLAAETLNRCRSMEWFGRWSYSIYLFHIPAAALFSPWLALPACYVCFRLVELPCHKLAREAFHHFRVRIA